MVLPHSWQGSGEPLVLIAGLGGKGTSWHPFLERASAHYRVLTFDNPGAGEALPIRGRITIREMAGQVLDLLDHLGVPRAHVVGRSMGGMIAQELALRAPERVARLVLAATSARSDAHLAGVFRLWAELAESGAPLSIRHKSSLLWCLGKRALEAEGAAERYLVARARKDRPADYALQARACAEHDALDRLSGLAVPTLVLSGADDRLTPTHHAEALVDALPDARGIVIPAAGHLAYLETPDEFAAAVLDFLAKAAVQPTRNVIHTREAIPCPNSTTAS
jgi:pimeloyl-ACP methyl ester carboxylesterase